MKKKSKFMFEISLTRVHSQINKFILFKPPKRKEQTQYSNLCPFVQLIIYMFIVEIRILCGCGGVVCLALGANVVHYETRTM